MSKITRYNGNLKAFASEATGTERTIFGDTAQSDTLDANITMDLLRGWGVIGVASNPTKQHFNGLAFTLGQLIAYLHQRGVPEWNSAQEYYQGSVVTTLVGIYRLKSGGVGSSDPDTDGGINWELIPTQAKVDAKAAISGQAFSGNISAPNLSGTNTGDQTKADIDALNIDAGTLDSLNSTEFVRSSASNGILSSSDDLDSITIPGHYGWNADVPVNAPFGKYCVMIVERDGAQAIQLVYGSTSGQMAMRRANSGTYGGWTVVLTPAMAYFKTEVNNLLNAKADQATTYTETEVDGLLDAKAAISGQAFSGNISAPNLSGTNTGDQTLSEIGVGQTWQDVSGSRAQNTNYTNSTGKPIMVSIVVANGSTDSGAIIVDSVGVGAESNAGLVPSQFIVPNGSVYLINSAGILAWSELR